MTPATGVTTQKIVRTREFMVSGWDDVHRVVTELKIDRFTGKVVIHMNQGGINAISAEDSKKLAT